ncbi:MAG: hypothetical protein ABJE80_22890 [Reichenbachiella sp.]|uniref:hypothetical protein n=1 Tax=Reichenbachiella sp. TaxID=2184521 RepID=UPI0032666B5F
MKEANFGVVGKIKLNSYQPLCSNLFGREAIKKYHLNPYIDGSCRREPDLENKYPSISSLCRQDSFATKLYPNDVVVYMALKSDETNSEYRLVSILKVKKRCDTHYLGKMWYDSQNELIPNNCMVKGNPPKTFDMTKSRYTSKKNMLDYWNKPANKQKIIGDRIVEKWNSEYQQKSERWSTFIIAKSLFNSITLNIEPPVITTNDFKSILGRVPLTRTPNNLSKDELKGFCDLAKIKPIFRIM